MADAESKTNVVQIVNGRRVHDFRNSQNITAQERAAPRQRGLGSLDEAFKQADNKPLQRRHD